VLTNIYLPGNRQVCLPPTVILVLLKASPANYKDCITDNPGSVFLFYLIIRKKQQQQSLQRVLFRISGSRSTCLNTSLNTCPVWESHDSKGPAGRFSPQKPRFLPSKATLSPLKSHAFSPQKPRIFLPSKTTLSLLKSHAFINSKGAMKSERTD